MVAWRPSLLLTSENVSFDPSLIAGCDQSLKRC